MEEIKLYSKQKSILLHFWKDQFGFAPKSQSSIENIWYYRCYIILDRSNISLTHSNTLGFFKMSPLCIWTFDSKRLTECSLSRQRRSVIHEQPQGDSPAFERLFFEDCPTWELWSRAQSQVRQPTESRLASADGKKFIWKMFFWYYKNQGLYCSLNRQLSQLIYLDLANFSKSKMDGR